MGQGANEAHQHTGSIAKQAFTAPQRLGLAAAARLGQRAEPQGGQLVAPGRLYLRRQVLEERPHVPAQAPGAQAEDAHGVRVGSFLRRRSAQTRRQRDLPAPAPAGLHRA